MATERGSICQEASMQFIPLGSEVVLNYRGLYRVAKLYSRDGYVFAKYGSGFVGLYKADVCGIYGTTKVGLLYEGLEPCFRNYALPSGRVKL